MERLLVDACNLRCPLPLLKLKQALNQLGEGDEVEVRATDAGSWRDIPAFIDLTNHSLLEQEQRDDVYRYVVRKGA